MGARRKYKDHFLVYYDKTEKDFITITPKDWARKNKKHFPRKKFIDSKTTPTVEEIGSYLKDKYSFVEFTYEEVVVLCNFDTKRKDF